MGAAENVDVCYFTSQLCFTSLPQRKKQNTAANLPTDEICSCVNLNVFIISTLLFLTVFKMPAYLPICSITYGGNMITLWPM